MAQAPRNGAIPDYVEVLAGQDGSATRALKTDANGELQVDVLTMPTSTPPTGASATQVQGTGADGVPPVGNPVLMGGQDGTNAQSLKTNTAGQLEVAGALASSAGPAEAVLIAGTDGSGKRALWVSNPGYGYNQALVVAGMKDTGTGPVLPDSALEAADADDGNDIQAVAPMLLVGTTHARARGVSTSKPGQATALADGSTADVWTPASGKKFRLLALVVGASVAGRYALVEGAGNDLVLPLRLPANQSVPVVIPANGILAAAANNVLKLRNNTGAAADLDWCAWGMEE